MRFALTVSARPRSRIALSLLLLAACSGGGDAGNPTPTTPTTPTTPAPVRTPASLATSAGDAQQAASGAAVPVAPAVLVRDASGQPLAGVVVTFSVVDGGGRLTDSTPTTDAQGVARVGAWTLGANGAQRVRAQVGSLTPVTFAASLLRGTERYVSTIGTTGGTFTITQPEYAFNGLALTVPAGALSDGTRFEFRELPDAPTLTLPPGVSRVGAVLEISTNQSRASELLTLDVPLPPAPTGTAALVALRDPVSGAMELLPLIDRTATTARVATHHLRGNLLFGATPIASSFASASVPRAWGLGNPSGITVGLSPAHLLTLLVTTPLAPATGRRTPWFVREHGSALHPEGHGAAIPLFEWMSSRFSRALTSVIRAIDRPGGYLEAGPVAALALAEQQLGPSLRRTLDGFSTLAARIPTARRDSLLHQLTVTALGTSGDMIPAAHGVGGAGGYLFTSVTAGNAGGLTFVPSAQASSVEMAFNAPGFLPFLAPTLALRAPVEARGVLPLSSFLVDLAVLPSLFQSLAETGAFELGSVERDRLHRRLARDAGLADIIVELEAVPGGGRFRVNPEEVVMRTPSTRVFVRNASAPAPRATPDAQGFGGSISSFSLHDLQGLTVASGTSSTDALRDIPAFSALSTVTPTPFALTVHATGGAGGALQAGAVMLRMIAAPFEVTPARDTVGPGDLRVTFEANVPRPPADGFRVHWDWGDGTTSENLGVTTATHEYSTAKHYRVIITLRDVARTAVLGVDTVQVMDAPGQWVGSVSGEWFGVGRANEGTTYFTATNVTWEPDLSASAPAGYTRFRVTGGLLRYWREVPCANWVGAVRETALSSSAIFSSFLFVSDVGLEPASATGRLYFGQATPLGAPRLTNKLCIETFRPNPEEYDFAGAPTFFQAGPVGAQLGTDQQRSSDPDLLEGSYTRISGGLEATWRWRFERRR